MNFDVRKQLLEFDDVANDQRKVVYNQRHRLLVKDDISESVKEIRREVIEQLAEIYMPADMMEEQWDVAGFDQVLQQDFNLDVSIRSWLDEDGSLNAENISEKIITEIEKSYHLKEERYSAEVMRRVEKSLMLQLLDNAWKDHLAAMDQLRQGIHLRGYAQKNPTQEYKRESFEMFKEMMAALKYDVISTLGKVEIQSDEVVEQNQDDPILSFHHQESNSLDVASIEPERMSQEDFNTQQVITPKQAKVGRNDPCICGSGKKYKHCCGKLGG